MSDNGLFKHVMRNRSMVYEQKKSLLENIEIIFDESTERLKDEKSKIYSISAINTAEYTNCPKCGGKINKKDSKVREILDYRQSPVSGEEQIYAISLTSQRYYCPTCVKSFTAGMLPRDLTHTHAFDKYIVQQILQNQHLSYSAFSHRIPVSRKMISKIVLSYVKDLNRHFFPRGNYVSGLYLNEFMYRTKTCYYIASISMTKEISMLAFFGYEDGKKELSSYLELLFEDKKEEVFPIMTDNPEKIRKEFFPSNSIYLCKSHEALDAWIDSFEYKNGCYHEALRKKVVQLKKILQSSPVKIADIYTWWSNISDSEVSMNLREHFQPVYDLITDLGVLYFYDSYRVDFSGYNNEIRRFNANGLPFERMCMLMFYKSYGDTLFSETNSYKNLYKPDAIPGIVYQRFPYDKLEKTLRENDRLTLIYLINEAYDNQTEEQLLGKTLSEILDEAYHKTETDSSTDM